jgi:sugar phosphate isomerase/epimerase
MGARGLADTESLVGLHYPSRSLDRQSAIGILSAAEVPSEVGVAPEDWPIGAAMLQFPSLTPRGIPIRQAGEEHWRGQLDRIKRLGFDWVEIPSAWLPIGEMEPSERSALVAVIRDVGLTVCATSVVRQSIIEPRDWKEHLADTHRAIDATAEIGSSVICLGLQEPLTAEQAAVPWFWTKPGRTNPDDDDTWRDAVMRYRELAEHAAEVDIAISLEVYEGTYLGSADSAVAFMADIDRENVGLNPDLGNLIRAQRPIEPWEAMAVKLLPLANYWHVKNYARAEDSALGVYLTTPISLANGLIDYRIAVAFAIASGFRGPILCENYGGDGLAVSAENARYLRSVLSDVLSSSVKSD